MPPHLFLLDPSMGLGQAPWCSWPAIYWLCDVSSYIFFIWKVGRTEPTLWSSSKTESDHSQVMCNMLSGTDWSLTELSSSSSPSSQEWTALWLSDWALQGLQVSPLGCEMCDTEAQCYCSRTNSKFSLAAFRRGKVSPLVFPSRFPGGTWTRRLHEAFLFTSR